MRRPPQSVPLAARVLFEPLAPWLSSLGDDRPPGLAQLRDWLDATDPRPSGGSGFPLQFVAAGQSDLAYEQQVYRRGEVPTRAANWHDAFNALVWLRFPKTKAALNARHIRAQRDDGIRGAARDAATLFDESGVIVVSDDPALCDALREHRWREVFVERRADLAKRLRFVIFGHALYDQMRAPFRGLCGKALCVEMPVAADRGEALCGALDAMLADALRDPAFLARPAALHALPMLGIPGVTPDSEQAAYYDDADQFRPRRSRAGTGRAPACGQSNSG